MSGSENGKDKDDMIGGRSSRVPRPNPRYSQGFCCTDKEIQAEAQKAKEDEKKVKEKKTSQGPSKAKKKRTESNLLKLRGEVNKFHKDDEGGDLVIDESVVAEEEADSDATEASNDGEDGTQSEVTAPSSRKTKKRLSTLRPVPNFSFMSQGNDSEGATKGENLSAVLSVARRTIDDGNGEQFGDNFPQLPQMPAQYQQQSQCGGIDQQYMPSDYNSAMARQGLSHYQTYNPPSQYGDQGNCSGSATQGYYGNVTPQHGQSQGYNNFGTSPAPNCNPERNMYPPPSNTQWQTPLRGRANSNFRQGAFGGQDQAALINTLLDRIEKLEKITADYQDKARQAAHVRSVEDWTANELIERTGCKKKEGKCIKKILKYLYADEDLKGRTACGKGNKGMPNDERIDRLRECQKILGITDTRFHRYIYEYISNIEGRYKTYRAKKNGKSDSDNSTEEEDNDAEDVEE